METIEDLMSAMQGAGVRQLYIKVLAANDNSKNQVYLGDGFGALNILPHGEVTLATDDVGGAKRPRKHAKIALSWIDEDGLHTAPHSKLILYPRYPELRLSGFLLRCKRAPSTLMGVAARVTGRVLFLGVTEDRKIVAHVVHPANPIAATSMTLDYQEIGVFRDVSKHLPGGVDPRGVIIAAISAIAAKGWVPSSKMSKTGVAAPYMARNGGGYTLEAELGIVPNGISDPDFHGWEVKNFAVTSFARTSAKNPTTLMTPEPDGGLYHDDLPAFMMSYGYPDKNGVANRRNFGGIYKVGTPANSTTRLQMQIFGFDPATEKMDDEGGRISLVDNNGTEAAIWSFDKLMPHWTRKHARAAFVPSIFRDPPPEYRYSARATLCVGTDFTLFLRAIALGKIYLDPALKAPAVGGVVTGNIHRRCQFRVRHSDIPSLYRSHEVLPV